MKKITKVLTSIIALSAILCTTAYADIVTVRHDLTKEEIAEMIDAHPSMDKERTMVKFEEEPSYEEPFYAGKVSQKDLDLALNEVKIVRFLAGVPYEHIKFTDELNSIAQHGAVLLAASNQFTHCPNFVAGVDSDFFDIASKGCLEANISAGVDNLSIAVLRFMHDLGQNNISRVGHRRWILKPGAENFGMGYAHKEGGNYGGHRINMYVFDGKQYWECESDSFIAWPNAGYFPTQYFTEQSAWSVNLGYEYAEPSKDDVVLKLTRKRDGKVWIFDKNTPNLGNETFTNDKMHLSVDNAGSGIQKGIVFRPDMDSLGSILSNDIFTVEISGIKYTNGRAATLKYDVNFFNLDQVHDNRIIFKINEESPIVFGRERWTDAYPIIRNSRTMLPARFVAEYLGAGVEWDADERKVIIKGNDVSIELTVGSSKAKVNGKTVEIDSPVFIENDRTYTPVRFIAENLNAEVDWNQNTQEVIITAN